MAQLNLQKQTGGNLSATEWNTLIAEENLKDLKLSNVADNATANDTDANLKSRINHTGTQSADTVVNGTVNKVYTAVEQAKFITIQEGATANSTDASLRDRSTHTSTQLASTISDLQSAISNNAQMVANTAKNNYPAADASKLAGIAAGATLNDTDVNLKARTSHTGTQTSATISDFTEAVQDAVALLLGAGSNITLTYNDVVNTLTVASTGGGTFDPEAVRDAIGVAMVGVGVISIAVNDAGDTITISSAATTNSTDANLRDRTTHTGVQAQSTITNLVADLASKQSTLVSNTSIKTLGGVTVLGSGNIDVPIKVAGKIPEADLPVYNLVDAFDPSQTEQYDSGGGVMKLRTIPSLFSNGFDLAQFYIDTEFTAWIFNGSAFADITRVGLLTPSSTGTFIGRPHAFSTYLGSLRRSAITSGAAPAAGYRLSYRSSMLPFGLRRGLKFRQIFCNSDPALVAGARTFVGLINSNGSPASAEVSSNVNFIGLGNDTADTNMSIMHNDATGVATKIDLGVNFPANTSLADVYELKLNSVANSGIVTYIVINKDATTGVVKGTATGTISTDLPTLTTALAPQFWRNNNATALEVTMDCVIMSNESGAY